MIIVIVSFCIVSRATKTEYQHTSATVLYNNNNSSPSPQGTHIHCRHFPLA